MKIATLIQDIQYVLAPAVMVSSTALLLLGWQTKFSNLATRFRALHHERRLLAAKADRGGIDEDRLRSVQEQLERLMRRAACVKRAIVLAYGAIICFMASSVLIFFNVYTAFAIGQSAILVFLLGLAGVLAGAGVMVVEATDARTMPERIGGARSEPPARSDDDGVLEAVRRGGATTEAKGRGSAAARRAMRPPQAGRRWRLPHGTGRWGGALGPRAVVARRLRTTPGTPHFLRRQRAAGLPRQRGSYRLGASRLGPRPEGPANVFRHCPGIRKLFYTVLTLERLSS